MDLSDEEGRPAKFNVVLSSEPLWRKSSLSGGTGNCVEFAAIDELVLVRDSGDPAGVHLRFTHAQWRCFLDAVRLGEFEV